MTTITKIDLENAMKFLKIESSLQELNIDILNKQYRKMSIENHPDKVGPDEEAKKEATVRMALINASKDVLEEFLRSPRIKEEAFSTAPAPAPAAGVPESKPVDNSLRSIIILAGGTSVLMFPPTTIIASVVILQAARAGVFMARAMAELNSLQKYGRPYQFGDLFLNNLKEQINQYQFGDLLLNNFGRKITGKPDYKIGDGCRAALGFFKATPVSTGTAGKSYSDEFDIISDDEIEPSRPI